MSAMSCNDFNCSRLQPHDLPEVYRGKQLHHLVYKRKAKQVEDFSNCAVAEAW
ncbi:hypothetical protein F2Q68_00029707 [Brassica cretica]|uniref:Uncharacterized protein n=1 Tax=Brassica cretica TaxID=69181 RepID=A0A8S9GIY6_BRACR|nr:hypothetical protein F2Q68_00029707 [Brassica cretica]